MCHVVERSWLLRLIRFQTWFLDQFDDDERHGQNGNDYDEELKNNSKKSNTFKN